MLGEMSYCAHLLNSLLFNINTKLPAISPSVSFHLGLVNSQLTLTEKPVVASIRRLGKFCSALCYKRWTAAKII